MFVRKRTRNGRKHEVSVRFSACRLACVRQPSSQPHREILANIHLPLGQNDVCCAFQTLVCTYNARPRTSMFDESKPQQVNNDPLDNLSAEEAQRLRQYTRSPHPYLKHGLEIAESHYDGSHDHNAGLSAVVHEQGRHTDSNGEAASDSRGQSTAVSVNGSESGTEADDERPVFIRALPAPTLRSRKGLKEGENEEALLTPSQLDDESRQLDRSYFPRSNSQESAEAKQKREDEQEKLFRRRLNEFARRTSEVGLVGVILLSVLYGLSLIHI